MNTAGKTESRIKVGRRRTMSAAAQIRSRPGVDIHASVYLFQLRRIQIRSSENDQKK